MSHEQSETIQTPDGQWINVYGHHTPQAGQPLPGSVPYKTMQEAVAAAQQRSQAAGSQDDVIRALIEQKDPRQARYTQMENAAAARKAEGTQIINERADAAMQDFLKRLQGPGQLPSMPPAVYPRLHDVVNPAQVPNNSKASPSLNPPIGGIRN